MIAKKRDAKKSAQPVFESIRKKVAPPAKAMGDAKPSERAHPAKRKAKHKKRTPPADEDAEVS